MYIIYIKARYTGRERTTKTYIANIYILNVLTSYI